MWKALISPNGANACVTDLADADDTLILSSSYREIQGLLTAVNHHAATIGMRISATMTKGMSALTSGTQRQVGLLNDEPSEGVDKFKYVNSMFVVNGQGSEEIRSRINLDRSAFFLQQSCLLPTSPHTWRRRTGFQLNMWETTIKADLEILSKSRELGYARWKKDLG